MAFVGFSKGGVNFFSDSLFFTELLQQRFAVIFWSIKKTNG